MRILVFFDLPTEKAIDRKIANKFRKMLIDDGFIMMQESVYVKLALNNSIVNSVREKLYKESPSKGSVQMLIITEKQFSGIEFLTGRKKDDIVDNTERFIVL